MDEFSLYVLDIAMNSVNAGAANVAITVEDDGKWLTLTVSDDGCGMTDEQLARATDPFFTTRRTRGVGLGLPLLKMLAERTGGYVRITSVHESAGAEHGTDVEAKFGTDHIDFIPLGDFPETVKTLVQGAPEVDFTFTHKSPAGEVKFSCGEIRKALGDVSLANPEVLKWIGDSLREQYDEIKCRKNNPHSAE